MVEGPLEPGKDGDQLYQHNFNPDDRSKNPAFPGGYGDEAWFGVMGTAVSNNRDPKIYWDKKKNGPVDPDKRIPRNTYNVLKQLFKEPITSSRAGGLIDLPYFFGPVLA